MSEKLSAVRRAQRYVSNIQSGRIPACQWVRFAVDRHVTDLKQASLDNYRWAFDEEKAERACKVIENLPHTKGKWAAKRDNIRLEDWQCFILTCIFGWVDKSTGMRRFRRAGIYVPRKNGKSIIAAGIGIYMFAFDNEFGAEVQCNATSEKQAWEVFRPAKLMVQNTPKIREARGIEVNAKTLTIEALAAKFEPVIGKPGDGASPSCGIVDEYHEHATSDAYDTLVTGMGAREQPLMLIITTAGDNIAGPCYAEQLEFQEILAGKVTDDRTFAILYGIDPGDDWQDPAVLAKANPNLGVSVDAEFLLDQQQKAIRNPRDQARFKTKHLNIWVQSKNAYFNEAAWSACEACPPIEELAGRRAYIALDLASKIDIAALELVVPLEGGQIARFGKSYLPEDRVNDPAHAHYQEWREKGYIEVTKGNVTDYSVIEEDVIELCKTFDVQKVGYDPFQGTYFATRLMDQGLPMVEYKNLVVTMSDPMKSLDAAILSGKLRHNCGPDHPMTWQMGNVVAQSDAKDNVYPRKEKEEKKIDNPVALIMAFGLMLEDPDDGGSIYEERGLLML